MQNNTTPHNWKKTIALFMTGQAISLFGSALVDFAIIWHITLQTQSGTAMTIGVLCSFVPRLLISLFAGVWADRYNRKWMIIAADGGIAISILMLAIAFVLGFDNISLIFVILGIRSIGGGIQTPAVSAIIPQIVPEDKLMKINGINGSLQSAIFLLSPAVSGALLSLLPLGMLFFIDVFTAAISIVILLFIPIKHHALHKSKEKANYLGELKEGLLYVKHNVFIREMLIIYAFYFFLIAPAAFLSPLFIVREFGDDVWFLTANEIAYSLGTMLGGFIIARWGGLKNGIDTIAISCFVIGFTNLMLGISGFYFFLAMMFIMGIFISFFSATEMTLFQKKVELNMQGRVFSLVQIVSTIVMPIGMLLFGPLGDVVQIELLFVICGILISILGIYIFRNKRLKTSIDT